VYLARDTRLEREVALSIIKADGLDDAGRMRVRREAQAMARLGDHPNVGTVHDIVEEDGQLYIVSEYMAGGDLDQVLDEAADKRRLAIGEAVRIATELCCALEHAHAHGVVHRDVKPGNVWLSRDGAVKLGDFGLAVSTDRTRLTHEGMMVGTAAYMAPEQALGRAADARSDLYALGATLYEMLTGRPPLPGRRRGLDHLATHSHPARGAHLAQPEGLRAHRGGRAGDAREGSRQAPPNGDRRPRTAC
jgi:serine/threonine protein kinase